MFINEEISEYTHTHLLTPEIPHFGEGGEHVDQSNPRSILTCVIPDKCLDLQFNEQLVCTS